MRNRFDHLAKQIGREALGRSGATVVHDEISPETQHADLRHEPDPARKAERDRLGLLGRIASTLCLIEIYGHAPNPEEFRACLAKHIAFWQQRARKARADQRQRRGKHPRRGEPGEPSLWIIAAGAPTALLRKLPLAPAPGWPAGVYLFGADILRVGIVVASELPRDRSTLLVRLMAAGPLLANAVKDLNALPRTAHERTVADQILLKLSYAVGQQPKRTPEEQEFIVIMRKSWEDAQAEQRTKGRAEGRAEGRIENQANAVLTVLRARGIAVPEAARKRILAQTDLRQLQRWHERAIVATSLDEVMRDRASARPAKAPRPAAPRERTPRRSPRAAASR